MKINTKGKMVVTLLTGLLLVWGVVYTNCGTFHDQQADNNEAKNQSVSALSTKGNIILPIVDCKIGYVWNGTECVAIAGFNEVARVYCPTGTIIINGECKPVQPGSDNKATTPAIGSGDPIVDCMYGYVWDGTACIQISTPTTVSERIYCPYGTIFVNGECKPVQPGSDNKATTPAIGSGDPIVDCIYGYVWNGTACVPTFDPAVVFARVFCPAGTYHNGTECVPFPAGVSQKGTEPTAVGAGDPVVDCIYGYVWNGTICVPIGGYYNPIALAKLSGSQFADYGTQFAIKFLSVKTENENCKIVPARLVDQANFTYHINQLNKVADASNTIELSGDEKCGGVVSFEVTEAGKMNLIKGDQVEGMVVKTSDGKEITLKGLISPNSSDCYVDAAEIEQIFARTSSERAANGGSGEKKKADSWFGLDPHTYPIGEVCHDLCGFGGCCSIFGI